ncbi:MAG TPA: hypothetical protein VGZ26_08075 [Pirellulales bacterium]|nr:hypothetical protein [Pirellulales bacterium]
MLVDRKNLSMHARWIAAFVVGTLVPAGWFLAEGWRAQRWPGGSSFPGLVFGSLAGLIIVFELLLWPRKRLRAWRVGRAQAWLRAHVWLGLLSVPLVILHSGGHLDAPLSVWLVGSFTVVILSGIWGLALQQFLPKLMFNRVPAETIYSEIERISAQNCYDAEDLVLALCGPAKDHDYARLRPDAEESDGGYLTVGGYRAIGKTRGKVLQARAPTLAVANSEPLRTAFYTLIGPYLKWGGRRRATPLGDPLKSAQLFLELKPRLDAAAHSVVDEIEELCSQRRQFDIEIRLHHWLHGWLLVHAPLSIMLFVLLLVHIYAACKYW